MPAQHDFFATCPRQLERLLVDELEALGAEDVERTVAGVYFSGPMEIGYRAVLWTRLAAAVVVNIETIPAASADELYEGVRDVDWRHHLGVDDTLKVTFTQVGSEQLTHTQYGAQKVKDAIVDQFRETTGDRPDVQLHQPDVHVNCHVDVDEATLSIDLAGESLHRRSYRDEAGPAPIRENTAAAMLMRADWPEISAEGRPLFDPMCGAGTLLIEGALMAADHAPGLLRDYFGFNAWRQHDPRLWEQLLGEARERARKGRTKLPVIAGSDIDERVVETARRNVAKTDLERYVDFQPRDLADTRPPAGPDWPGLLVTNAPYGERLGSLEEAAQVHEKLGDVLKDRFGGWNVSILTGSQQLGRKLGVSADSTYTLYNGPLECLLVNFEVFG